MAALDSKDQRIAELQGENEQLHARIRELKAHIRELEGAIDLGRKLLELALERIQGLEEALGRVTRLEGENATLRSEVAEMKGKLTTNSTNSSKPPSSDGPEVTRPTAAPAKPAGRKPGGQPGHARRTRELLPPDQVDPIEPVRPTECRHCQHPLGGEDPHPLRHQVTEIPRVQPTVTEYQLHALTCPRCGETTRADLPPGVPRGDFGPVLMSMVSLCAARFRQSKRLAQELLETMLGVHLSTGAICKVEQQTSEALAEPVEAALEYVREQEVVNGDETGWYEGKEGGRKRRAWLWLVTTPLVTVFLIARSRGEAVARQLLGAAFQGIFGSDRWSAYDFLDVGKRQLCWSHLLRDFQGWVDRGGVGKRIGKAVLDQASLMFQWWHRIRDGTLKPATFQRRMEPVKREIGRLLRKAAVCADKKVRGMAKAMLKLEHALFTFVAEEGVEPTNNVSERQARQGVIMRKLSFGTESEAGSRFVERMLTATSTLRQQDRDVLGYLIAAHRAWLEGLPAPSLLPAEPR